VIENLLQTYPKVGGILAANDAMAIGALDALDGADRKAQVVGGVMAAVRTLHKQPVPKDISLKTEVVTSANYQSYDVAPDKLTCPAWADAVGQ
jgi:ribose transport system substrate-binding protein